MKTKTQQKNIAQQINQSMMQQCVLHKQCSSLSTPQNQLQMHEQLNIVKKQLLGTTQSLSQVKSSCANKLCKHYNMSEQITIQISIEVLCNSCQEQYRKQSFCVYCKQIYYDNTDDGKDWIECEDCGKWVHSLCAHLNTRTNNNHFFKCIRCKVVTNQAKRLNGRAPNLKTDKKKNNDFLSTLGFDWELNNNQIAEDMENLKQYLKVQTQL